MKTKGCEVWDGYLASGWRRADGTWTPTPTLVPDALWARLKHRVSAAGRVAEFKTDEARLRETLGNGHDLEVGMFRLWVGKLGLDLPPGHYPGTLLWPWSRGWTDEAVDAYLVADAGRAVAEAR